MTIDRANFYRGMIEGVKNKFFAFYEKNFVEEKNNTLEITEKYLMQILFYK